MSDKKSGRSKLGQKLDKYEQAEKDSAEKEGILNSFRLTPVEDALTKGEKIIKVGRVHWGIFVPVICYLTIAFLVGTFFHPFVGSFIVLLSMVPLVSKGILYLTTALVLTNKRVFIKFGYFNKDLIQIRISRLESAHLERPFLGQILGYATVVVLGTGAGSIPVNYIGNGRSFVRALEDITLAGEDLPEAPSDDDQQ